MTPVIAFGEALIDMLSSRLGDTKGPDVHPLRRRRTGQCGGGLRTAERT